VGRGGRNLELALGAAEVLDGSPGVSVFSFATDGKDGSTDAAGAIVDGVTARRIREAGDSVEGALRENNSYSALRAAASLWITGPTGTNVNDVTIAIGWPCA
jgi:hydroxypyruvate reductase